MEATAVAVVTSAGVVTFVSVYRPPRYLLDVDDAYALLRLPGKLFLASDFNAKHAACNSLHTTHSGRQFHRVIDRVGAYACGPDELTCYPSRGTPDVLDFAITKGLHQFMTADVVHELNSNHLPVLFNLAVDPAVSSPRLNLPPLLRSTPLSRGSLFRRPGLPADILDLIRISNRLSKEWRLTRYPLLKRRVNLLRRNIKAAINAHKNEQSAQKLASFTPDPNAWDAVRFFTKRKHPLPPLDSPTGVAYTPVDKANALADVFQANFVPLDDPVDQQFVHDVDRGLEAYLSVDRPDDDHLPIFTTDEVTTCIWAMAAKKAPGADDVPGRALRELPPAAHAYLPRLFTAILLSSFTSDAHFWDAVRFFAKRKAFIPPLGVPAGVAYAPLDKANALADIFEANIRPIDDPIDLQHVHHVEGAMATYLAEDTGEEDDLLVPITPAEIKSTVAALSSTKAPCADDVPVGVLKELPHIAFVILATIFNSIIWTSNYPTAWRREIVVAVPKPGQEPRAKGVPSAGVVCFC
ncbi:uncharacterized protein LOC126292092 [Schistocerca gregaria]|uniref:uncharacterized protein LOC126292092 n=1 Tax=Schistocerca gregaria TaxID=7010 RepID=UPI00211F3140|nr:uncharacterized protein LOC126292092 [Schistocerca gregaria]